MRSVAQIRVERSSCDMAGEGMWSRWLAWLMSWGFLGGISVPDEHPVRDGSVGVKAWGMRKVREKWATLYNCGDQKSISRMHDVLKREVSSLVSLVSTGHYSKLLIGTCAIATPCTDVLIKVSHECTFWKKKTTKPSPNDPRESLTATEPCSWNLKHLRRGFFQASWLEVDLLWPCLWSCSSFLGLQPPPPLFFLQMTSWPLGLNDDPKWGQRQQLPPPPTPSWSPRMWSYINHQLLFIESALFLFSNTAVNSQFLFACLFYCQKKKKKRRTKRKPSFRNHSHPKTLILTLSIYSALWPQPSGCHVQSFFTGTLTAWRRI